MLDGLQYWILKKIAPGDPNLMAGSAYDGQSKLDVYLRPKLLGWIQDKTVIDFGCGEGEAVVDLVRAGARQVIGIDIRENVLERARLCAAAAGVGSSCVFATGTETKADVIVSLDAFEHFEDPGAILEIMDRLLKPDGRVIVSFGPTWYHPLGGHLFSVFPWAHVMFSEEALIRWRSTIRSDGATRFSEVEGGLNQMTIARFERLIAVSKFKFDSLEMIPIRRLKPIHVRLTREFTTACVKATLVRKSVAS